VDKSRWDGRSPTIAKARQKVWYGCRFQPTSRWFVDPLARSVTCAEDEEVCACNRRGRQVGGREDES
jgi:hypothetical protein